MKQPAVGQCPHKTLNDPPLRSVSLPVGSLLLSIAFIRAEFQQSLLHWRLQFSFLFVRVWHLVVHNKWRTYIFPEHGDVGSNTVEVKGYWRKPHNEVLHSLYFSPKFIRLAKSRMVRWVEYIARVGRRKLRVLVNKLDGKGPLGRQRRRRVRSIEVNVKKNWWAWTGLIWLQVGARLIQCAPLWRLGL